MVSYGLYITNRKEDEYDDVLSCKKKLKWIYYLYYIIIVFQI